MSDESNREQRLVDRRSVLRSAGALSVGAVGLTGRTAASTEPPADGTYVRFCGCSAYCLETTNGGPEGEGTLYTAHEEDGGFRVEETDITNGCDEPGGKVVIVCVDGNYYCNTHTCSEQTGALAAAKEYAGIESCDNDDPNVVIENNEGGCGRLSSGGETRRPRAASSGRPGNAGPPADG